MPRLAVVLCVIALVGAVTSSVLYFQARTTSDILTGQLIDATSHAGKLEAELSALAEQHRALQAKTKADRAELTTLKARLAGSEAHAAKANRDANDAKAVLAVYEQTARALAGEVAVLRQELADTRASQASPDAVAAFKKTIAELERQLAAAHDGAVAPTASGASTAVFTNRHRRASVLTVGPDNAFVVLNFGAARGAQLGQKLQVSQGTDVVATILISDVRANFSVAQVLPDTLRGVLHKGDSAVLLR